MEKMLALILMFTCIFKNISIISLVIQTQELTDILVPMYHFLLKENDVNKTLLVTFSIDYTVREIRWLEKRLSRNNSNYVIFWFYKMPHFPPYNQLWAISTMRSCAYQAHTENAILLEVHATT